MSDITPGRSSNREEITILYVAMLSGGASVKRMNMEALDMAKIPANTKNQILHAINLISPLDTFSYFLYQKTSTLMERVYTKMDKIDRLLLDKLQKSFPVTSKPYSNLGRVIGVSEEEVIARILDLKKQGIVRQISAIFNTVALGYKTSLVAMSVPENMLEKAASVVNRYPGVSHNYLRPGRYNMWFTIAVPPGEDLTGVVERLSEQAGRLPFLILPAIRKYKLAVVLDMLEDGDVDSEEHPVRINPGVSEETSGQGFCPSERNVKIVKAVQEDLPLVSEPFFELSREMGISESELLETLHQWINKGWIRRFAAVLNHRKAGFIANGMIVWNCKKENLDYAGKLLASTPEVSHCYCRPSYPDWPYNLYAMVHGKSQEECKILAERLAERIGIREYAILFSTREFKKVRLKLFWDEEQEGV